MRDVSRRGIWVIVTPLLGGILVGAAPQSLRAQTTNSGLGQKAAGAAKPFQPCCDITGIDSATGMVSAKAKSTGQSFQFKVADTALLNSLKVGQQVFANFKTQQVSVDGAEPCCNIVSAATRGVGSGGFQQDLGSAVNPGNTCCAITGIDASGRVTAQDRTTGKTFQFQANDSGLLNSLHIGQAVAADYAANQVSVNPGQPCCQIIGAGVTSQAGPVSTAGTSQSGSSGSGPGSSGSGSPSSASGSSGSAGVVQSQEVEGVPGLAGELTEVTRSNDVLPIKMRFHNTSGKPAYLDLTKSHHCDNYYVTAGKKRYAVLKDAQGVYQLPVKAYCNDTVAAIAPDQVWTWWGRFQAPPATVKKVDFFSPIMPPFQDVAVTDK